MASAASKPKSPAPVPLETAESKPKSLDQIHLEARVADLKTIIENLPSGSPILQRKKAHLATVEAELAALLAS